MELEVMASRRQPGDRTNPLSASTPDPSQRVSHIDPLANVTKRQAFVHWTGIKSFGPHPQNRKGGKVPVQKHLDQFHGELIALGGTIGTGFLIGSGQALYTAGPISVLIAFAWTGLAAYLSVFSLGELCAAMPVKGAFVVFSGRFIDQAWGAAIGWMYALQWLVVLPLELIAASLTLQFWAGSAGIPPFAWIFLFLGVIVWINLYGIRGYGNFEAGLSITKIIAIVGFLLFGVCRDLGLGWPGEVPIGATNWYNPGPFRNSWKGLFSVMVTAAFAHSGVEVVGLAAVAMKNHRKTLPKAVRNLFYRIVVFYMGGMLIVGLLVKHNDRDLLGAHSSILQSANASPFVIALREAKVRALPTIFNVVVLVTVLSVANTSVFCSTQTLTSMAENGTAPKWLLYYDTKSRPLAANGVAFAFGLLAFFAQASYKTQIFDWLLALSGFSVVMTWASICVAHISFRRAYKKQGRDLKDDYALPFRSPFGIIGSYVGLFMNFLIIVMQVTISIVPVDYRDMSSAGRARNFFQSSMAFALVSVVYIGFKFEFGKSGWRLRTRTVLKHPGLTSHPDDCRCNSKLPTAVTANDIWAQMSHLTGIVDPKSSSATQACRFVHLDELLPPPAPIDEVSADGGEDGGPFVGDSTSEGTRTNGSMVEGQQMEDPEPYRMNGLEKWIAAEYHKLIDIFSFPWP